MTEEDGPNETSKKRTGASTDPAPANEESAFSEIRSLDGSLSEVANSTIGLLQRMSESAESTLSWPPRKEDLQRLYVDEHLSAMKIAQRYVLKYASPKTAESTVLYHLKKAGISRRDCAEHVRKVTDEMVDEWVKRYGSGESLKQIAGQKVDPVSVWVHLKKRGLRLRDKVEAQIQAVRKHERRPFEGSACAEAYLLGFARGDLYVTPHGRSVRVRTTTSHPAMTRLFRELFSQYGHVYEYPRRSQLSGFEWSLDCDLDASFQFLLEDRRRAARVPADPEHFMAFLAGFFDAEGSVYFHRKKRWGAFELSIANKDEELLRRIAAFLTRDGYSVSLRQNRQKVDRGVKNGSEDIWRLTLWRYADVTRLLKALPLRHPERTRKAKIAFQLGLRASQSNRDEVVAEWEALAGEIRAERDAYVRKALESLNSKKEAQNELSGPLQLAKN